MRTALSSCSASHWQCSWHQRQSSPRGRARVHTTDRVGFLGVSGVVAKPAVEWPLGVGGALI